MITERQVFQFGPARTFLVKTAIERRLVSRPIRTGNVPAGTHSSCALGLAIPAPPYFESSSIFDLGSRELSVLISTFFLI